jgi:hypothetical protein
MANQLRAKRGGWGVPAALTLALAAGAGSLAATSAPAIAQGPADQPAAPAVTTLPAWGDHLNRIKAQAANWITTRIRSLGSEISTVQSLSFLGADGTTLTTNMQSDITGLQALGSKIQTDTTVDQARADAGDIFTQFRVYYLVLPVASSVINADHVDSVLVPQMNQYISQLQADQNPSNQGVIGPLVSGIQQEVQVATSATSGLSGQILAFTPAQWNADHDLLAPSRAAIASADKAVYVAEREYYQALRYLDRHPTTTTTTATTTTSLPTSSTTGTTTAPTTTTTAEPARLAFIKERAARAILARTASINRAIALVQGKNYLGSDQATLISILQADLSDLQALGTKIESDTTVAQALADYRSIFTQLRVYLLAVPMVDHVIHVDYVVNVSIPAVNQEISSLESQVNTSNQGVLDPLITDMQDQVQVVSGATSGLSAELLAFTPAEWNANHRLFANVNADIATANHALAVAANDNDRALAYLRHGLGHKKPHKPVRSHGRGR